MVVIQGVIGAICMDYLKLGEDAKYQEQHIHGYAHQCARATQHKIRWDRIENCQNKTYDKKSRGGGTKGALGDLDLIEI